MDLGLKGKRALVTGSTRGIGRAITEQLLSEGAQVAICARDAEAVDRAVSELSAKGTVHGRAVDVADTDALTAWLKDAAGLMGGLDIFVPNVSVGGGPDKWEQAYKVDLMGTVRGCETAIALMQQGDGGAITLVSTTGAIEIWREPQAYNVIKAGLLNYAKNLSDKVGPSGIRVNAVAPGPIYFEGGAWPGIEKNLPEFFASVVQSIPLGHMGEPADIAKAITFLSSDAAKWVSGATLVVDGGRTRRVDY